MFQTFSIASCVERLSENWYAEVKLVFAGTHVLLRYQLPNYLRCQSYPASSRGAIEYLHVHAGLINQLPGCRLDPRIA